MMGEAWLKKHTDALTDEKLLDLPAIARCAFDTILLLAKKAEIAGGERGVWTAGAPPAEGVSGAMHIARKLIRLMNLPGAELAPEHLADYYRVPAAGELAAFLRLMSRGERPLIVLDEAAGTVTLPAWERRQALGRNPEKRSTVRERVRRHRAKRKPPEKEENVTARNDSNGTVTAVTTMPTKAVTAVTTRRREERREEERRRDQKTSNPAACNGGDVTPASEAAALFSHDEESQDRDPPIRQHLDCRTCPTIIAALASASGRAYRTGSASYRELIHPLHLRHGPDALKVVIQHKAAEWRGHPTMDKSLRPGTLFGDRFAGYLEDAQAAAGHSETVESIPKGIAALGVKLGRNPWELNRATFDGISDAEAIAKLAEHGIHVKGES